VNHLTSNSKKILFTIIPLALIFILCSSSFISRTQNAWGSISGSSTEYLLESSIWIVNINDFEKSGEGAFFNEININRNTRYDVDVLDVDNTWGVDYKITNNTDFHSDGMITSDMFLYQFSKFIYYPLEECKRLTSTSFDEDQINRGPPLILWFFIEPEQETWDFLTNLTNLDYHNSLPNKDLFDATLQAELEIANNLVIFDMYMRGSYKNESENTLFQFDHMIKFVWNDINGILQGHRVASYINGRYKGYSIVEELQIVNRKSGFDLPRFKYVSGFLPGFEYLIAILGIMTIFVSTIIIRKKRNQIM